MVTLLSYIIGICVIALGAGALMYAFMIAIAGGL
jgi:hypothetical protein